MGAIRGSRLPAETKLGVVCAVAEAKQAGATVAQACRVLKLNRTRLYRWVRGRDMEAVQVKELGDKPPVAKVVSHKITPAEREAILEMAQEEQWADLRHRKLAHMLGRLKEVFVSESTVLRVLRAARLVLPGKDRPYPDAGRWPGPSPEGGGEGRWSQPGMAVGHLVYSSGGDLLVPGGHPGPLLPEDRGLGLLPPSYPGRSASGVGPGLVR